MFYLADLTHKEVFDGEVSFGSNPSVLYDNVTRKCALKTNEQLFAVDKIIVGKKVKISGAKKISETLDNGAEEAICPFGEIYTEQRVYDVSGKFLGELENAEFTSKFLLNKLWVKDAEFKRGQIFSVGDAVIIKAKTPKQLLLQRERTLRAARKPKVVPPPQKVQPVSKTVLTESAANPTKPSPRVDAPITAAQNVTVLPTAKQIGAVAETSQTTTAPTTVQPVETPVISAQPVALPKQAYETTRQIRKRYGNFNFLLGKVVDKTIVNFQGEVMIKKNESVTKEVLRQAKISGKLIELYLHVE